MSPNKRGNGDKLIANTYIFTVNRVHRGGGKGQCPPRPEKGGRIWI